MQCIIISLKLFGPPKVRLSLPMVLKPNFHLGWCQIDCLCQRLALWRWEILLNFESTFELVNLGRNVVCQMVEVTLEKLRNNARETLVCRARTKTTHLGLGEKNTTFSPLTRGLYKLVVAITAEWIATDSANIRTGSTHWKYVRARSKFSFGKVWLEMVFELVKKYWRLWKVLNYCNYYCQILS